METMETHREADVMWTMVLIKVNVFLVLSCVVVCLFVCFSFGGFFFFFFCFLCVFFFVVCFLVVVFPFVYF